jgi:hypothetical protein
LRKLPYTRSGRGPEAGRQRQMGHANQGRSGSGGKPDLGVNDFAASVVYMANQSGANWKNPDDAMLKKIDAEIQRRKAQLRK